MYRFIVVTLAVVLFSCSTLVPEANLRNASTSVDTINQKATSIEQVAKDGKAKASQLPHWDWIDGFAQTITKETVALRIELKALATDKKTADQTITRLTNENKKLREEAQSSARWVWRTLIGLAGIAMAGGIALGIFGFPKLGIGLVLYGIASGAVSQFMLSYAWLLSLVAGALLLLALGWAAWEAYDHRKSLSQMFDDNTDEKTAETQEAQPSATPTL